MTTDDLFECAIANALGDTVDLKAEWIVEPTFEDYLQEIMENPRCWIV